MALNSAVIYDISDPVWYGTQTYPQLLSAYSTLLGMNQTQTEILLNTQYGAADYNAAVQGLKDAGYSFTTNSNGASCLVAKQNMSLGVVSSDTAINSNATTTAMVGANPVYNSTLNSSTGKVEVSSVGSNLASNHGFYNWQFFAAECLQAVSAASVGIWLGKTIDSTLYNLNPDFWDNNGMSTINPETWATITNGDDSFAAGLFNTIMGIDPNTGEAAMFIDENAAAYIAYYLKVKGAFSSGDGVAETNYDNISMKRSIFPFSYSIGNTSQFEVSSNHQVVQSTVQGATRAILLRHDAPPVTKGYVHQIFCSDEYFTGSTHATVNSKDIYRKVTLLGYNIEYNSVLNSPSINSGYASSLAAADYNGICYYALFGEASSPIEGIGTQDAATLPDTSSWSDLSDVLPSLQQQYPSTFADAVPVTAVQPDGTTTTTNYIPIPIADVTGQYDSQPTSGTQTQSDVKVSASPDVAELLKTIVQLISQPEPNPESDTDTNTPTDTTNPPDTGTGDSPTPVSPTGSASALWSVYHPTQAQINSFGAWLWSTNFIDQIKKLFQNPIDGVISLQKVFATPVDSGSGNIVVGNLDSGVSSATVTQQYVTVDCGNVDCQEDFGSVFDYPPYTQVSLYLPFIGIVSLDVNDVMRSTIHVSYGVDVFTGACLAMVEVIRDGATVNMYQYSGVCSVQYPLTSTQNAQLASGLLTIAGGVASVAASGGVSAPAAISVAAGAVSARKSTVSRSGGFSGNAGAMGIKKPYLILQRPQTKVAELFPSIAGYPTNKSGKLSDFSGQVVVSHCHVEGIPATDDELKEIETLLRNGVLV